ncbi:MAG: hypothetical protein WA769_05130, partial [Pseudolabrys sp.]
MFRIAASKSASARSKSFWMTYPNPRAVSACARATGLARPDSMIVVQWAMRSAEESCGALQALQASSRDVARAAAPEVTVATAGTAKAK